MCICESSLSFSSQSSRSDMVHKNNLLQHWLGGAAGTSYAIWSGTLAIWLTQLSKMAICIYAFQNSMFQNIAKSISFYYVTRSSSLVMINYTNYHSIYMPLSLVVSLKLLVHI